MSFHLSESKLRIAESAEGSVGILECSGRIIFGREATEFVEHSRSALSRYDVLFIQLRNVTHMDARGLGALVDVHRTAVVHDRTVVYACPSSPVLQLLCLTNLHSVLSVHLSEAVAWRSLNECVA